MTDTRQPNEQQPYSGSAQGPNYADSGYEAPAGMPPGGYYPSSGPQPSAYGQWWSSQQQGQWAPQQGQGVPQQQGPWGPQQSGQWNVPQGPWGPQPPAQPQPKNGLAMPAPVPGGVRFASGSTSRVSTYSALSRPPRLECRRHATSPTRPRARQPACRQ